MAQSHAENYIRREKQSTHSVDDQVTIAHAMWGQGKLPNDQGVKRTDLEPELGLNLDYTVKTSLRHLEEINMVEEYRQPGPDTYVIADWHDETFIMGMVDEAAEEGIEALLEHVQDDDPVSGDDTPVVADGAGMILRQVVAEEFDLKPDALEQHLRGDNKVDKLNDAVEGIEEHNEFETRDDYGEIRFVNVPYRYRLTAFAVDLYQQ
jgi:hypothetical protein